MNIKKPNFFIALAFLILFAGFFHAFISARLFDSDFWWHISTGRYIVETGTIPDKDPFSYTSDLQENKNLLPERENFILKQYWLGQVIFYLIYEYAGPAGVIILRGALLTMMLLLVLWQLKRWDVIFYISFILVFLLYLDALRYTGERPVLFVILFTPLTFILLEEFKNNPPESPHTPLWKRDNPPFPPLVKGGEGGLFTKGGFKGEYKGGKGGLSLFLLPLLMLLWSNLHGGFIIGNIIIAVYMLCEGLKIVFKKASYSRRDIITFYTATNLALIASYINPTGWEAFSIALSPKYVFLETGIQEYQSPFLLYLNKLSPFNYGYFPLALLFPIVVLLRNKRMDFTHIVLLTGFFIMAAKSGRYTIYYASLAAMVLGKETNMLFQSLFKRIPDTTYKKMVSAFSVLALLSSILFFIGVFKFQWLMLDVARGYYIPVQAVDFIEKNRLQGNILNSHPYGGYVAWRLYPWKKTFLDTRWLNYTLQSEYAWMMNAVDSIEHTKLPEGKMPLWKRLLEHYKINCILFDTLDVYGNVPRLLLKLPEDDEWVPVYTEPIAVIFVKNVPENRTIIEKFRLPKDDVYNTVIFIASEMAVSDRQNPRSLVTLGKTFHEMGRLQDALTAYQYSLKRLPDEPFVKEEIAKIEAELKEEKKNERN
ncbi:MAG: hypothetical protein FJ241_01130 [Nitrospira sp.]|nr:hypothetical protein [Nitrospira sp.]